MTMFITLNLLLFLYVYCWKNKLWKNYSDNVLLVLEAKVKEIFVVMRQRLHLKQHSGAEKIYKEHSNCFSIKSKNYFFIVLRKYWMNQVKYAVYESENGVDLEFYFGVKNQGHFNVKKLINRRTNGIFDRLRNTNLKLQIKKASTGFFNLDQIDRTPWNDHYFAWKHWKAHFRRNGWYLSYVC